MSKKKLEITKCFKCHRVLQANARHCGACGSNITLTSKRTVGDMPEVEEGPLDRWMD